MRNRRLLWCLGAGVLLLAAGAVLWVVVRVLPDRVTPENYYRIKVGMTEREVEAILGGPADAEASGAFVPPLPPPTVAWMKFWVGERWVVIVDFDSRGRVVNRDCDEGETAEFRRMHGLPELTFWRKLRRSLGW
jgi:hypothetical protein